MGRGGIFIEAIGLQSLETLSLKAEVVMGMVPGNDARGVRAGPAQALQLGTFRGGIDDERREKLFEDLAVFLQQEAEEVAEVIADEVDFQPFDDPGMFDRLVRQLQADDILQREEVRPGRSKSESGEGNP